MKKKVTAKGRSRAGGSIVRKKTRAARPLLKRVQSNILFDGVRPQSIVPLIPKLTERKYAAGEVIFDEYTLGRDLYLILKGRVKIKKYTKYGIESLLAVLHEGDFFGELSILDGLPRSARAEAMEECIIVTFQASDLRELIKESDAFTFNLLKNLALRLRTMDQTFVRELEHNALASKSKMEKLNLLVEASKSVNSTIDLDKLLGLILDAAARSVDADRGTLYLVDTHTNELWSKITQGQNMIEIRLPMGKGLAGYVAKTGETVNITDAYKDPRFNPEIDKKSGYKTRNVLCMPMRDKGGNIVGVFQFLNKRHGSFTAEDESFIDGLSVHAAIAVENARIAQEMVKSERLSAVGRMASSIIHDIKNPMSTLRLYAQVLKKKAESEEGAQMADEIMRQVDRFVNMTQEILDFSRGVSEMKPETIRLEELMQAGLKLVEADIARKNITLVRNLEYSGEVTLDIEKMIRVFYNLASNAADAMPNGGALTVSARKQNGSLLIEFTDTGSGIPEELRAKVFEPFVTYGKKHGTGLGLSIVKKIIDDHQGKIEVESEVHKGTTIRMILPLP
jgi:K+-sensing histidine kinase KdpD